MQSCNRSMRLEIQRKKSLVRQKEEDREYANVFGDNIKIHRNDSKKISFAHSHSESMQSNSRNINSLRQRAKSKHLSNCLNGTKINSEILIKNQNYLLKLGKRLRNIAKQCRKSQRGNENKTRDLFSKTTNMLNLIKLKSRPQTTQNRRIGKSSQSKRKIKLSEGFGKEVSTSTHFKSKESIRDKNNLSSNFDGSSQYKSAYDWSLFFPMNSQT